MNSKILVCFALVSALPQLAFAKQGNEKAAKDVSSDYKCHVVLNNNSEVIKDYRWLPARYEKSLEKELMGKTASTNGHDKFSIVEVKECVLMKKSFSSLRSRELDKTTLR